MSIKSGRTDYVIAGESVQLSCHYIFTGQYERVIAVNWKKDGQEVELREWQNCFDIFIILLFFLIFLFFRFTFQRQTNDQ